MKTLKQKMEIVFNSFEYGKRNNGDGYYYIKDDTHEWVKNAIRNAHGDLLPNDYVYDVFYQVAEICADLETYNKMVDVIYEIEPPVYNCELIKWISSNLTFAEYADEVLEEEEPKDFFNLLICAYGRFISVVGSTLLSEIDSEEVE